MTTAAISEILATRLATLSIPIEPENGKYTPVAGTTYLRETMLGDFTQHRAVAGGARSNRTGLWQVTVMAAKDGTRKPGRMAAEQIEALFPAAWRGTKAGVTVAVRQTTIGPSFVVGDRYAIPITVDWFAS